MQRVSHAVPIYVTEYAQIWVVDHEFDFSINQYLNESINKDPIVLNWAELERVYAASSICDQSYLKMRVPQNRSWLE